MSDAEEKHPRVRSPSPPPARYPMPVGPAPPREWGAGASAGVAVGGVLAIFSLALCMSGFREERNRERRRTGLLQQ